MKRQAPLLMMTAPIYFEEATARVRYSFQILRFRWQYAADRSRSFRLSPPIVELASERPVAGSLILDGPMLLIALGALRYYCQCLRVPVRYTYYFLILLTNERLQERNDDTYVLESNTKI